jgi:hypothetical protein
MEVFHYEKEKVFGYHDGGSDDSGTCGLRFKLRLRHE